MLGIFSCEASVIFVTVGAEVAAAVAPGNGALIDVVVADAACEVVPEDKTLVFFYDIFGWGRLFVRHLVPWAPLLF